MLHDRRRIVEVVQQSPPFLKSRRLTEPDRVILHPPPFHEQQILARRFHAALQPVRNVSVHGCDDRLRLSEGLFEVRALAGLHMEYREFKNHGFRYSTNSGPCRAEQWAKVSAAFRRYFKRSAGVIDDATTFRAKDQVLFDLAKALHFSPESLEVNRQGKLSAEQAQQFVSQCAQPAILTVVWALAPFLIWTSILGMQQQGSYLGAFSLLVTQLTHIGDLVEAHGRLGAAGMIGSFVVCLGLAIFTATRISPALYFDVLERKVKVIEGRVVAREEQIMRPNGRDPIEKYFFSIKNHDFPVTLAAFRALENGSIYLVYLLPRSEILVSLEPKVVN